MRHKPVKSGTLFEKDLVRRVITQGIFVAAMTTVRLLDRGECGQP